MSNTDTLEVGEIVINNRAFTSPIGDHFAPGTQFTVDIVEHSTRARSPQGAVVWMHGSARSNPWFVVAEPVSA